MEFNHCVSLREALTLVTEHLSMQTLPIEEVSLTESLDRVIAATITAKEALPAFNRSTVDGFAVNSRATFGASEGIPVLLQITGEILMGKPTELKLLPGQAVIVPTGGQLPPGTDAVIMNEYTETLDHNSLLATKAVAPGENVITTGEDFNAGDIIARQGQIISPQIIGALAACGYSSVPVNIKPLIAIISTGDEIVSVNSEIRENKIRDINSHLLAAMLTKTGCTIKNYGIIPDNYELLRKEVGIALATSQMIIISGGSSVGIRDHSVRVMQSFAQNTILFHGITVKPGKPTIFAMLGNTPVFGLPGHPLSAMTICQVLLKPAVLKLLGQQNIKPIQHIMARLTRNVASAPGRYDFIRVKLSLRDGNYWAEPIFGKSGLISTSLAADGLVHITDAKSGLYSKDLVEVELLY